MPANSRWDLKRVLRVKVSIHLDAPALYPWGCSAWSRCMGVGGGWLGSPRSGMDPAEVKRISSLNGNRTENPC